VPDDAPPPDRLLGLAAEHAARRVPVALPAQSSGGVRAVLAGRAFDSADDVAVLEGRMLAGVLPIERLLAADTGARVADVMDSDPPVVAPEVAERRGVGLRAARPAGP